MECCGECPKRECRKCYNSYMNQYMKDRYYKRRDAIISRLGGVCVLCGSKDSLEIDHISRKTKSFDIGKAIAGWSVKRLEPEIEKCQLLCSKHHKEKTKEETSIGHGEGLTGKRGCYCEECGPLKSTYIKNHRSKKNKCKCGKLIDIRSIKCRSCNCKQLNKQNKLP